MLIHFFRINIFCFFHIIATFSKKSVLADLDELIFSDNFRVMLQIIDFTAFSKPFQTSFSYYLVATISPPDFQNLIVELCFYSILLVLTFNKLTPQKCNSTIKLQFERKMMSDRFSHVEKHRNPHNGTRGSAQQHRFYFQINQNPVKGSHPNLYGWLYQIWIHLKKPALTPSAWPILARNKMISKTKSRYDRVLTYKSKYMLQRMYIHNFEMKQPKAFFNFTKSAFSSKFCPFCFVLILEYWFVYKRNV